MKRIIKTRSLQKQMRPVLVYSVSLKYGGIENKPVTEKIRFLFP